MKATISKNNTGTHGFDLPEKEALKWLSKGHKRVLVSINHSEAYHSAIQSFKPNGYRIQISQAKLKELNLKIGHEISVKLLEDTNPVQFHIPEEWTAVLEQDTDAERIFQSLRPGNQRSILFLINKLKSAEKRIEKSLHIAELLKSGITNAREMV